MDKTFCFLVLSQCVVPYLSSFMDEAAAKAISQTFLDTSYEVTQERVKEVRAPCPCWLRRNITQLITLEQYTQEFCSV